MKPDLLAPSGGDPDEFRRIANSAPVPIWVTKLDRKRSFVNQAYLDFLGVPFDRAVDFDWRTIIHPDDAPETLTRSIAGEASLQAFTLEARYRRADGEWRWLRSVSQPRYDAEGAHAGYIGVAYDVTEAREAEQAARRSAAGLAAIVSQTVAGIAQTDLAGRFTLVNGRYCEIVGRPARELATLTMQQITHPDDLARTLPLLERAVADGTPCSFDKRYVRPDGAAVWVNNSVSLLRDPDGAPQGLLAVSLDITERRQMDRELRLNEAALRRSEERLRLAVQGAHMGTWDWDFESGTGVWSARTAEIMGTSQTDVTPAFHRELVHPDDREAIAARVSALKSVGDEFSAEYRVFATGGRQRWVSAHGVVSDVGPTGGVRLSGMIRDVTERRRAQEQLAELNRTLEEQVAARTAERDRMWDTSPDLMLVMDLDGVFRRVNPAWSDVLGYSADELVGHHLTDFVVADDHGKTKDAFRAAARGRDARVDIRCRHKDGSVRQIAWVGAPGGDVAYATGRDVTAEREAAEALHRAEDQLRQAQKVEAVGQLTGGVAHDFNNLLTVIRGSVDLLRRPGVSEERKARYIDAIGDTADRAARLTNQLLAFARRQALTPEAVDVRASVQALEGMINTLVGSRIRTVTEGGDEAAIVHVDRNQLDTAIINMAVNARDAMGGEGVLNIGIGRASGVPATRSHPAVPGDFVAITLRDTGEGIPADRLERIFEPFFTTKKVGDGTGLGLSQVFGFAKQSGGEITVDSEVGRGTAFTLYLPAAAADRVVAPPDEAPQGRQRVEGACVLVVEDNLEVGSFARTALAELGYSTVLATDAMQALGELDAAGDRFDLVFSDVVMPGMSGIDLAQEVQRRHPGLPIVLTSGYSTVLAEEGCHGFELVHKPYSVEQLAKTLDRVIDGRS